MTPAPTRATAPAASAESDPAEAAAEQPPAAPVGGATTGRRAPVVRDRLVTAMPSDRVLGWLLPGLVAVIGGILRFWHLAVPPTYVFDETYYAREAWRLLRFGVEYQADIGAPEYVVHPPLGKWVIGIGEWIFGNDSFGWRFSVAVLGTLAILMVGRIARRMFRSTVLGTVASVLLCFDSLEYVMSRTALLDTMVMFFALAAFGALLIDRDHSRTRLGLTVIARGGTGRFGPGQGLRPWRLAAGLLLGMACASKWNGLWFVAVFGLASVLWDVGARRAAGACRPFSGALLRDSVPAFASLVIVPFVVYLVSWTGWFLSDAKHAYFRDWAAQNGGGWPIPGGQALRSLWHYHVEAYTFDVNLHAFHPYSANPWSWVILGRPISYYYEGPKLGQSGCTAAQCSQAILAIGNPVIWWGAVGAIFVLLGLWAGRRDWRAGAILAGIVAGYLPWFNYQARTIFYFYAVAFTPWLVLADTMVLGLILGPPGASPRRRAWGASIAGAFVLLAVVVFWWFFPILTAQVIPYRQWQLRMWLPSWV